jgi:hypothetical protein
MTIHLVLISDTHAGHRLGLCNPETSLYDTDRYGNVIKTYKPEVTDFQQYLWSDVLLKAVEWIRRQKGDKVVMHMGDMTHGDGHAEELTSTRMHNQIRIATANMQPLLTLPGCKKFRAALGTGVHEFGEGSAALLTVDMIKATYPGIGSEAMYHGLAEIGGVGIDYAHHGPGAGVRTWLWGNNARFYLRDLMIDELQMGNIPPVLVLRGHVHTYVNELLMMQAFGGEIWSRLLVVPSMCGLGDYGRKVTRSEFILRNGILDVIIDGGRIVDVVPFVETLDLRTKETIL